MDKEDAAVYVASLLILALLFGAVAWGDSIQCHNRWDRSGFQAEWGIMQGCMIKVDDRWIPSSNWRETE